jgi:ABC-type Na+ efflux pump permease subunit
MQIVTNVTVLAIILVGAAVIREREHGTIEHLLVMPVRASEIAFAKIIANGLVIHVAALGSLLLVVQAGWGAARRIAAALFDGDGGLSVLGDGARHVHGNARALDAAIRALCRAGLCHRLSPVGGGDAD